MRAARAVTREDPVRPDSRAGYRSQHTEKRGRSSKQQKSNQKRRAGGVRAAGRCELLLGSPAQRCDRAGGRERSR